MSDVPEPDHEEKPDSIENSVDEQIVQDESADANVDSVPNSESADNISAEESASKDSEPEPEVQLSVVSPKQYAHSLAMTMAAVKAAAENRGQDIVALDVSRQTSLFDFFVIITGSSRRQMYAVAEEIDRSLKEGFNERRLNAAKRDESRWAVLDYGNIVVHLFEEDVRAFYDLESLWGDAKPVDISDIVAKASTTMARFE